jgi:hypothetical protein
VNRSASIADVAGNEIARRNAQLDSGAALVTEVHGAPARIRVEAGVVEHSIIEPFSRNADKGSS